MKFYVFDFVLALMLFSLAFSGSFVCVCVCFQEGITQPESPLSSGYARPNNLHVVVIGA